MKRLITIPTSSQPLVGDVVTLTVTGRVVGLRINPNGGVEVDLEVEEGGSEGLGSVVEKHNSFKSLEVRPSFGGFN